MKRSLISTLLFTLLPCLVTAQGIEEPSDSIASRSLEELLGEIVPDPDAPTMNLFGMPKVFMGYRHAVAPQRPALPDTTISAELFKELYFREEPDSIERVIYSVSASEDNPWNLADLPDAPRDSIIVKEAVVAEPLPGIITGDVLPEWLVRNTASFRNQLDIQYRDMIYSPSQSNYAFWTLPVPPTMPPEDYSYAAFLRKLNLSVNTDDAVVPEIELERKHWLHLVNAALQFSQAYLSR
ncbi:MAG: hypothetical protein K2J87_00905, partial [Muribaculaceae bacterium]|nr:hypothetical protein [Muribaculaceae bacterium]